MKMNVEKIGPAEAQKLLLNNKNRHVRLLHVARLARDMSEGNWRPGSVIRVARNGQGDVLIDGQHRLLAVIESGVPIEVIMVTGHEVEDQQSLDTGMARTLSDTLALAGEVNTNSLAAAIGWLWRFHNGHVWKNYSPTIAEGLRVLREHPSLRECYGPIRPASRALKISTGLAMALYYQMAGIDAASADEFWDQLHTGLGLYERHPIYVLRKRLENNAVATGAKFGRHTIAAFLIKGWNAYIRGDEITVIRWTRGGASPEPFPELEGPN